jgi:O-antigen/teichoic acid export membrane protein
MVAAGLTWAGLVAAGRILGARDFAAFMVIWGLFFSVTGVLQGIQQETARETSGTGEGGTRSQAGAALLLGGGIGLGVLGTGVWWGPDLVGRHWLGVVSALSLSVVAYALANQINGGLAGHGSLHALSTAIALEAVVRTIAVMTVLLLSSNPALWSLALAAGAAAWVVLLTRQEVRRAVSATVAGTRRQFVTRAAIACGAAACSALFVSGFPVLIRVERGSALDAEAGAFLAALLLTRAPLLLVLNAYQGVVVSRFVVSGGSGPALLRRYLSYLSVTALTAVPIAFLAGPWVQTTVFGAQFETSRFAFVGLLGAGWAVASLTLSGWAALSAGLHGGYALGWVSALAVTAVLVWAPGDLVPRSIFALVCGPVVGMGVHVALLRVHQHKLVSVPPV